MDMKDGFIGNKRTKGNLVREVKMADPSIFGRVSPSNENKEFERLVAMIPVRKEVLRK